MAPGGSLYELGAWGGAAPLDAEGMRGLALADGAAGAMPRARSVLAG